MLNFDEDRFVGIQSGAVAAGSRRCARRSSICSSGARENLFFLGAGGAGVLMPPAAQLLDRMSSFPARVVHAAEIVAMPWNSLGAKSIVVVPSLSGTTAEAVTVLEFARKAGATSIALAGHEDSPVAKLADHNVINFVEDDTSSESFYLQSLLHRPGRHAAPRGVQRLRPCRRRAGSLPSSLVEVKRAFEERAATIARDIKDIDFHVITGAGNTWPRPGTTARAFSRRCSGSRRGRSTPPTSSTARWNCSSRTPACSCSRARTNRGRSSSASKPGRQRFPITSRCWTPPTSRPTRREPRRARDVSPVVLATLLERLNAHLEVLRNHPLTTRRYYRQWRTDRMPNLTVAVVGDNTIDRYSARTDMITSAATP